MPLHINSGTLKYWRTKNIGGRGEIRTHGGLAPTTVFKTVALNRSATLPNLKLIVNVRLFVKTVLKTVAYLRF